MQLNEEAARKVLAAVDAGLISGAGPKAVPGEMCVMQAISFALGLPHSDKPANCVGSAVRAYDIRLNDACWSSNAARTKGMRREAIAKLGSNKIDQRAFADYVVIHGVKRILPIALKAALNRATEAQAVDINAAIVACEAATSMSDARQAASLSKKATTYAYAAATYAAATYAAATYAAAAATYAAAAAYAATYAVAAAAADAAAYAAAAAADADADADADARDKVLSLAADIAVEALQKLNCAGCAWLHLCDEVPA